MFCGGWDEQISQARPLEWGSFGWQSATESGKSGKLPKNTGHDEVKLHSKNISHLVLDLGIV